ncbi:MAG: MogA/MoaB family molybdenum cofactor biosynthesis protein [Acidobacteria bacterium]|nr:MogA/MoaB family molybdenum cofactor biosynthesis protein [Acidobacteriota bacterium]
MIRCAVLTVSDSCFAGTRGDRSGPALMERVSAQGWDAALLEVVPDEAAKIATWLRILADEQQFDLVLTTGGTGLAPRDVTPEATRTILEREIPGLGELMRMEGLRKTPLAVLSRSLAGTRGRTLIVNLPGSPKGAKESFDAIVKVVPHIVDLLHGRTEHRPA